ncbi:MAG TPA: hypothetical protein VK013_05345, partial [Myxococcaceae bacterium]|nr:hypothetical protein [Myxococcaceae bacterium]
AASTSAQVRLRRTSSLLSANNSGERRRAEQPGTTHPAGGFAPVAPHLPALTNLRNQAPEPRLEFVDKRLLHSIKVPDEVPDLTAVPAAGTVLFPELGCIVIQINDERTLSHEESQAPVASRLFGFLVLADFIEDDLKRQLCEKPAAFLIAGLHKAISSGRDCLT